jgi:hypothetical protein
MELGAEKYRALSGNQELSNSGVRKYAIRRRQVAHSSQYQGLCPVHRSFIAMSGLRP